MSEMFAIVTPATIPFNWTVTSITLQTLQASDTMEQTPSEGSRSANTAMEFTIDMDHKDLACFGGDEQLLLRYIKELTTSEGSRSAKTAIEFTMDIDRKYLERFGGDEQLLLRRVKEHLATIFGDSLEVCSVSNGDD
jgi:hypothetical protein